MGRPAVARRRVPLARVLALLAAVALVSPAHAAGPARWTPAVNWASPGSNAYAVHMVLMAGDGTPHCRMSAGEYRTHRTLVLRR